ncbi:MAG: class I SAM-dependent methyltransferase [Nitrolancea sp.]
MTLDEILNRSVPPHPWDEGDKIPWNDPEFSRRMLQEHLTQRHDLASRRTSIIDKHVAWIHRELLHEQPGRVLDLGCGPGLYTSRFAALGHECVGIDFSPAAIDYARRQPIDGTGTCQYVQGDIREIDYGEEFDVAMLIFGELNTFRHDDALLILRKVRSALKETGRLLLEPHTYEFVEQRGREQPTWRASQGGVLSTRPHIVLEESFWEPAARVATQRTFLVDVETSATTKYVETMQAYTLDDYTSLLQEAGFSLSDSFSAMPGSPERGDLIALVAKPA